MNNHTKLSKYRRISKNNQDKNKIACHFPRFCDMRPFAVRKAANGAAEGHVLHGERPRFAWCAASGWLSGCCGHAKNRSLGGVAEAGGRSRAVGCRRGGREQI